MIVVDAVTTIEIVSRSRRASAVLLAVDLDDDPRERGAIADEAATTAYSRLSSPERHAELADAVLRAIMESEAVPGTPATGTSELSDGRMARATRRIT